MTMQLYATMNESAVLDYNCVTYDRVSQLMPDYVL